VLDWQRNLSSTAPTPERAQAAMASLAQSGKIVGVSTEEILCSLRSIPLSSDTFRVELAQMVHDRSKRWIFVPHFNVSEDPEKQIAKRVILHDFLKRDAAALGYDFYDPTPLVARAERATALQGDGADSYHYAQGFLAVAGEGLYDKLMEKTAFET